MGHGTRMFEEGKMGTCGEDAVPQGSRPRLAGTGGGMALRKVADGKRGTSSVLLDGCILSAGGPYLVLTPGSTQDLFQASSPGLSYVGPTAICEIALGSPSYRANS